MLVRQRLPRQTGVICFPAFALEDTVNPKLFEKMEYRNIGPFRGGRSVAVSGVDGNPNLYYMGAAGGGVN